MMVETVPSKAQMLKCLTYHSGARHDSPRYSMITILAYTQDLGERQSVAEA